MLKKILVLTDGKENAERAIRYAAQLCEVAGGELIVMTAAVASIKTSSGGAALDQELIHQANGPAAKQGAEILGKAKAILEGKKIAVQYTLEWGKLAETVLHTINKFGCDTVVVGNRGFGVIEGILKDSASQTLMREVKIPLIIIK